MLKVDLGFGAKFTGASLDAPRSTFFPVQRFFLDRRGVTAAADLDFDLLVDARKFGRDVCHANTRF